MSRKVSKTNKRSKKRSHKKSLKRKTVRKGGGCGCSDRILGGSAGLERVSSDFFYPLNDQINNPNTPREFINSERLMGDYSTPKFIGGKKKRTRKQKGGMSNFILGDGRNMDPVTSFGTTAGLTSENATLVASPNTNSSTFIQPVQNANNEYTTPLI
jgi:hypothetical protein